MEVNRNFFKESQGKTIDTYVNTNVSALKGQPHLNKVNNSLNTTYERLSSGLRINLAKDDAAGLQFSNRLTSQINGLNQGNRNANDGIALAQTIEAGIDEITNMLQRVRTLAVQSANSINTAKDREALHNEAGELCQKITCIAQKTTYPGKTLLKGSGANSLYSGGIANTGEIEFQIDANSGEKISFSVNSFTIESLL